MHRLFDKKIREFNGRSLRAETTYSFLDRSSLPEFERVRAMLERWVAHLPETHQGRAVANMRHRGSGSPKEQIKFNSAFFELFLHEFLIGTGGEVQIEPAIEGLTPDFKISEKGSCSNELTYVVEASDIDLERGTKLERDWNERSAIDALNEIDCPDFFLIAKARGRLESTPPKRKIKGVFEDLVQRADHKELLAKTTRPEFSISEMPSKKFTFGNWTIVGHLFPGMPETREIGGDFVGVFSGEADSIDDIGRTKTRLYDKARRYKNVDNLIIALRCDDSNHRLKEVLFGSQQFNFYVHNDPTETTALPAPFYSQKLDGFWVNSSGPQNNNVIGVVAFYGIHPWNTDKTRAIFHANPYLDKAMPEWTKLITHAEYSNGDINIVEGIPVSHFVDDYEDIGDPFG